MPKLFELQSIPSRIRSLLVSHALASVVLIASLVLVLWYWRSAQQRGMEEAEVAFRDSSAEVVELLRQRLLTHELLVRGGASLQASLPRPSRRLWQQYVSGLDIENRFSSVEALGFALAVEPQQLGALRDVLPGMAVTGADAGRGGTNAIVLYISPEGGDKQVEVGSNLARFDSLRVTMQQAAESGHLLMSPPPDGQATRAGAGALVGLLAPVYAGRSGIEQVRDDAVLRGWVFARLDVEAFLGSVLQPRGARDPMRILDITGQEPLLVHADPGFGSDRAAAGTARTRPAFTHAEELAAMGRRWRLEFESPPLATVRAGIPGLTATLLSGLLGSLLIVGIAFTLARTQSRANALAERMTESYRRSEQRFRSAMRYSAIGKALLDHEGNIIEANPALAQILGSTTDELVGTAFAQHFVDGQDAVHTTQREALPGEGVYRTTRRLRRSDGDVRHASLVFAAVPGKSGGDFASLAQVEDVTERMRAEARVQALNRTLEARVAMRTRELRQANRELESFAYSVSHDLRAPLRSIDGFSRLLAERYTDAVDESGQDYLRRIRNATLRMSELIDALLRMSRVSRGELKHQSVDLGALAQASVAELANAGDGRHVAIEVEEGLQVQGDPALLQNLVANLVGNAWKFTRQCPDARIRVGRNEAGEYFVRDNGAGFSPEYAQKLFRPFQRLHSQEEYPGHGIGLATVKRIVERHGGSIRAEGETGQGATFYFTLPDKPEEGD